MVNDGMAQDPRRLPQVLTATTSVLEKVPLWQHLRLEYAEAGEKVGIHLQKCMECTRQGPGDS